MSATAAPTRVGPTRTRAVVLGALLLTGAGLSALALPVAPGYDAWAWLTWGREAGRLELSTVDGPAWKPLPVAVTALLASAGDAAPALWVLLVRASAIAAVVLAFVLARRLAGVAAGVVAAAALALTGGFVRHAAVGDAEPLLIALALGAVVLALEGRHRPAVALGVLCALLRPRRGRSSRSTAFGAGVPTRGCGRCSPGLPAPCWRCGSCPNGWARVSRCAPANARVSPTPASRRRPSIRPGRRCAAPPASSWCPLPPSRCSPVAPPRCSGRPAPPGSASSRR
jgi:hypothetical protein